MPDPVLAPGATIGILGGGQLGRMLAMAAARLGLRAHIYSDASGPAFDVAAATSIGAFDDEDALRAFARAVDVATVEFENVPARALAIVGGEVPVFPPVRALDISQDRLAEKEFLTTLSIPVAAHAQVDSRTDLEAASTAVGLPALLKTRHLGYDGKGQVKIAARETIDAAYRDFAGKAALLEAFVAFEREVSVLAARGRDGALAVYDMTENRHEAGILAQSRVPARVTSRVAAGAVEIARAVADALDYVGVLCVEMFCLGEDAPTPLIVNEIAPRVHNSGHWTLDACVVSQFENHVRAVAGWPLGATMRHSNAVMSNLIGEDVKTWRGLAAEPGAAVHIYGKREARPGRKMGHVTRLTPKG